MRHYTGGYLICSQQQKERKLQCITRRQNKLNEEDTQITNELVSKRDVKKSISEYVHSVRWVHAMSH